MVSTAIRPALVALTFAACGLVWAADETTGQDQGVALTGETGSGNHRVHLGGISVSGGYSHFSGPCCWYPYSGLYRPWGWGPYAYAWPYWGFYDPFWYGPWYSPMFYTAAVPGLALGEVKLDTPVKSAGVYLNDAYAGTAKDLKSLWLEPGVYSLRLQDVDGRSFERRIYVLTGKTLKLRPEFRMAAKEQTP